MNRRVFDQLERSTTLKATTQRAMNFISNYLSSSDETLQDCYKSWSCDKQIAYNCIKTRFMAQEGQGLRVISHNGFCFTTAYKVIFGLQEWLIVDTRDNTFKIRLK